MCLKAIWAEVWTLKEQFPKANFVHEQSPEHPFPERERATTVVSVHRAKCAIDFIRSKYTYGQRFS